MSVVGTDSNIGARCRHRLPTFLSGVGTNSNIGVRCRHKFHQDDTKSSVNAMRRVYDCAVYIVGTLRQSCHISDVVQRKSSIAWLQRDFSHSATGGQGTWWRREVRWREPAVRGTRASRRAGRAAHTRPANGRPPACLPAHAGKQLRAAVDQCEGRERAGGREEKDKEAKEDRHQLDWQEM